MIANVGSHAVYFVSLRTIAGTAAELGRRCFTTFNSGAPNFCSITISGLMSNPRSSMMKRKFGDSLRSKTDVAMINETLCKILCHNLVVLIHEMSELNIDPVFWNNAA